MLALLLAVVLVSIQGCVSVYVEISPREAVVLPRQNVTFLCKIGVPIQYCRIQIPGMHTLNLSPKIVSRDGITYFGAGLQAGQCGATIESVTEANNGMVNCTMGIETDSREPSATMYLTVARAPKPPELDLSRGPDALRVYKVGDTLQASCVVRDGRPVANISWYLDDEPILEDLVMPTIFDVMKDDLHSIIQNMTRRLKASDNGKQLRCVAGHPALTNMNNQVSRQLDIKYAPLSQENPIDKFGYEIGKAGIISVDIFANPKPIIEWTVGDQRIKEGNVDVTGRLEAEQMRDEGRGHYIATLRIASITKQDTETQFKLTAYNDQGSTDYFVVISTSPEPEGLELEVGYIVLIVVALLFLLLVIFLLTFARATGRWCFSGRNSTPRIAGETSDTESAEVKHKESKLKVPKLNFAFKKNKDKVSHEDEIAKNMETVESKEPLEETEKQLQPKEGIVYAELDLVAQNLRPVVKNDDDKTEYAEIIYTPITEPESEKLKEEIKT